MYKVTIDRPNRRIRYYTQGFLDPETLQEVHKEMRNAALELRKSGTYFDLLVDFRESPVLTGENAEKVGQLMQWLKANGLRRTAAIVRSALRSMQVSRVAGDNSSASFESEEEAIRWLES